MELETTSDQTEQGTATTQTDPVASSPEAAPQTSSPATMGEAREAMEKALESAEDGTKDGQKPTPLKEQTAIVDLDAAPRFRTGGKEYTLEQLKQWQQGFLLQSDYTKKTQALAEERKFYDNLSVDLASVKSNPQLVAEFKRTYPEKFHAYLDHVVPKTNPQEEAQKLGVDPQFMDRFSRVETFMRQQAEEAYQAKVGALTKELENIADKMTKKYSMASEDEALSKAQLLEQQGLKLNDQSWNEIYKSIHDRNQKLADQYYNQKVKAQTQASKKASDVDAGGGVPVPGPRQFKTLKEASKAALQDIEGI